MPTITRELTSKQWQAYFDNFSRLSNNWKIEIEVVGLDIGDQIMEDWALLKGISYDHHNDALYVITEHFEHKIENPQKVFVREDDGKVTAIEIVDQENESQIIKIKSPLAFRDVS